MGIDDFEPGDCSGRGRGTVGAAAVVEPLSMRNKLVKKPAAEQLHPYQTFVSYSLCPLFCASPRFPASDFKYLDTLSACLPVKHRRHSAIEPIAYRAARLRLTIHMDFRQGLDPGTLLRVSIVHRM